MTESRAIGRVAVTGGAGFLGSRLVRSFLESGARVRAIGRSRPKSAEGRRIESEGLEFHELDVRDADLLAEAFADQDLVVHAAALIRASSPAERDARENVNVEGTRSAIEACRRAGVRTLLYVSTTAAIGVSPDPDEPADESFRFNMAHLDLGYGSSKHRAEQLVAEANGPSLRTLVVNPGFIFGRDGSRYRGSEVITRVLAARVVTATPGGLSIVHIDDVVDGIRRVAARGRSGERYILSGPNVSFREIADTVCQVMNRKKLIVDVPRLVQNLAGRVLNSVGPFRRDRRFLFLLPSYAYPFYCSAKARDELGYEPRSFKEIVADYAESITKR